MSIIDPQFRDISCRILTLSSSIEQATSFIRNVQAISKVPHTDDQSQDIHDPALNKLIHIVPWTISNRYYTASVHFAVSTIHGLSPHFVRNAPALIFVWAQGEPYKPHVKRIVQDLGGKEPEVSLAVRIRGIGKEEDNEDNGSIDEFLSENGFEYVDAVNELDIPRGICDQQELSYSDDIPHLPRVLDALSTVMWPSMKSNPQSKPGGAQHHLFSNLVQFSKDSLLPGSTQISSEASVDMQDLMDSLLVSDSSMTGTELFVASPTDDLFPEGKITKEASSGSGLRVKELNSKGRLGSSFSDEMTRTKQLKEEYNELFKDVASPLRREDSWNLGRPSSRLTLPPSSAQERGASLFDDDPVFVELDKKLAGGNPEKVKTPTVTSTRPGPGETSSIFIQGETDRMGFDDDFTVFVSAPIGGDEPTSGRSSPRTAPEDQMDMLTPSHVGTMYQSLGSVSDFGESDDERETRAVEESAGAEADENGDDDLPTKDEIKETSIRIFGHVPKSGIDGPQGDDESHETAPFDLSKVLSALQHMKAEIATMEDEDERRSAAARVALGLVYGLEGSQ